MATHREIWDEEARLLEEGSGGLGGNAAETSCDLPGWAVDQKTICDIGLGDLRDRNSIDTKDEVVLEKRIRADQTRNSSDISGPDEKGEHCFHLVPDEETVSDLLALEIPPDEYYEKLRILWDDWFPKAADGLKDHMMSLLVAFETATAFAMSIGIAKFALAQIEAKLVGEIICRHGSALLTQK